MQYQFKPGREVLFPVKVAVLREDGSGEFDYAQLKLRYRLLTREELNAKIDEQIGKHLDEQGLTDRLWDIIRRRLQMAPRDLDWLLEHITDWEGPVDHRTGEPIPYSEQAFRAACDADPRFFQAAFEGLFQASGEAPRKN